MSDKNKETESPETVDRDFLRNLVGFSLAAMAIAALAVFAFVGAFWRTPVSADGADWGLFGDYIGGTIGALVALATWGLLVATVRLQKRMIDVAQNQLKTSKEELRLTRDEMQRSTVVLRQQSFESTFFRMMEQVREAAAAFPYRRPDGELRPRSVQAAQDCLATLDGAIASGTHSVPDAIRDAAKTLKQHKNWPEPFFRLTYHTLKLIHYSGMPEAERMRYASIFRGQFADSELICLYFNLSTQEAGGLVPYVNYYGFLKHLPEIKGIPQSSRWVIGLLETSAFMSVEERKARRIVPAPEIALSTEAPSLA